MAAGCKYYEPKIDAPLPQGKCSDTEALLADENDVVNIWNKLWNGMDFDQEDGSIQSAEREVNQGC